MERTMIDPSPESLKEIVHALGPAIVGTAASMLFTEGTWKKRLAQGAVGVPFSMYMAPSVGTMLSRWDFTSGIDSFGVGVLTAVFGLAAVSYTFELWKQLQLGPMLREWVAKRLGVDRDLR